MTGQPPSLADWLQMLCLAVAVFEACSVPFFLLVDADPADFDPRPAARRVVAVGRAAVSGVRPVVWDVTRSEAVYLLLREWDTVRHTFREFGRDVAALVLLLTTSPKGQLA